MVEFDKKDFTYGAELEWGDIDRRLEIPEHLGSWEHSETDIMNQIEMDNIACDPLGLEPYWGGEVNTKPTFTKEEQVDRIFAIKEFFEKNGNTPTVSSLTHNHIHMRIPGLKDNVPALKRLTQYIADNQQDTIDATYEFIEPADLKGAKGAKMYLKFDGGRLMPEYMVQNILDHTEDFTSFIQMQCAGKDWKSRGRPFRYAINTYALKHTGTVEFRCFRGSFDRFEIESQFRFVEAFMDAALNDGPSVKEILENDEYRFPAMIWDRAKYDSWAATKYPKERGKKVRVELEVE
jgi:hypothetical protein